MDCDRILDNCNTYRDKISATHNWPVTAGCTVCIIFGTIAFVVRCFARYLPDTALRNVIVCSRWSHAVHLSESFFYPAAPGAFETF